MLDEIKEYMEYTCNLDSGETVRLLPKIFNHKKQDKMLGLPRALLIIARKELENRQYFDIDTCDQLKIRNEVKQVLEEWLGFCDETAGKLSDYNSWLKRYYCEKIQPDGGDSWRNIEVKKKRQYDSSIYDDSLEKLEVTYEGILADAINLGPLKQYKLVCKEGFEADLPVKGKKRSSKIDVLLKLISVVLIGKRRTGNLCNRVNAVEFGNWIQSKDFVNNKGDYLRRNTWGKVLKDECDKRKLSIDPDFLEKYDFQIVTKEEFGDVPVGYLVFEDQGAGKPLESRIKKSMEEAF